MGVQGLTSFLERNQRIYRDVQFSNSRVVIDGCNLNYQLYFSSDLDQNHGGEYSDFKSLIERFVSALRTCGISPYVILDGGSDVSNKKHETSVKRSEDRIQRGHHAAVSGKTKDILPKLADLVFQQTLAQLKVPVAQCFEESDQEIAALAFEWRCPVLSNDSDFYIFDLPGGVLPISHFQWEQVDKSSSQRYISCRRFNASSFCIFFGIESSILPIFAALAGNDYVKLREIQWTQFVPEGSESPGRLEGLLRWLREFQEPQDALEAALGLMGHLNQKIKKDILKLLHQGMEGYQLCPSILSRFFLQRVPPEFPALKQEFQLIPHWMLLSLTQARLTPVVLDVMRLHTMTGLGLGVEPEHLPSSNLTSRPVRQVLYGLLLGPESGLEVDEIDRQGLQLTSIPVQLVFSRTSRRFRLASLHQEELSDRLQVLLETLKVTPDSLSLLPPQLRLPLAVTWFWMHNAQPAPDLCLLKALLLGISTGTQPSPRTDLLDLDVVYLLTQWQACLKASIWLNQLLGFPLPEPEVARLYNGTLVHQLVHRMKNGGKLKNLLKSDRTTVTRYRTMLSILHRLWAQLPLEAPQNQHQATTRQRRQQRALESQTTNLKQLFHQDEEIENEESIAIRVNEELDKEEQMVVRTRYRTKERSNKSKKPELARKEECRGWSLL